MAVVLNAVKDFILKQKCSKLLFEILVQHGCFDYSVFSIGMLKK